MSIADPNDPRHGTYAGYRAHLRAQVPTCEPCIQGRRERERETYVSTGGRSGGRTIIERAATEDVDWVVIHRILDGRNCPANTAERLETVRRWQATGRTLQALQEVVNWNVDRYSAALRGRQRVAS